MVRYTFLYILKGIWYDLLDVKRCLVLYVFYWVVGCVVVGAWNDLREG
jgi:hypothetical protein